MFFTYLRGELGHRLRQFLVISLGLAIGIGLAVTVTAAAAGVRDAQAKVLHALYGIGTDIIVTQAPTPGTGGSPAIRFGGAYRPSAGTTINSTALVSAATLGPLKASDVTTISHLRDVSAAAGALVLSDTHVSGTIPTSSASPGSSISFSVFSVDGVQLSSARVGVLSGATITAGRTFTLADANSDVAVVDANYAKQNSLKAGSTVSVDGTKFTVIGIVAMPQGSVTTDVFIPLARAQKLSGLTGKVNTIYVSAASAADISTAAHEISAAFPKTTVTTSSDLASQVTGSLASAANLATNLGTWLAIVALVAAFLLAALLTMSAVTRRVREFGTLKALGWRSRRVIEQVMGESLSTGVIGGIAGIALGVGAAAVISALAPALTASTGSTPSGGAGFFGRTRGFGRAVTAAGRTVTVHLTAPVSIDIIAAAVLLAIAGGLVAGSFGGWRAARQHPASALTQVA